MPVRGVRRDGYAGAVVTRDFERKWLNDRGAVHPADSVAAAWAELEAGPPQYGTSMHYPSCLVHGCTGCLPPVLEGEIVEPWVPWRGWSAARLVNDIADALFVAGYDPAGADDERQVVFAQVRAGVTRVDVPDVR